MAASVLTTASVSSVSAAETESAVSYDDDYAPEIAADVTGMTEFVYYGGGSYYKYAADASGLIALKADRDNDASFNVYNEEFNSYDCMTTGNIYTVFKAEAGKTYYFESPYTEEDRTCKIIRLDPVQVNVKEWVSAEVTEDTDILAYTFNSGDIEEGSVILHNNSDAYADVYDENCRSVDFCSGTNKTYYLLITQYGDSGTVRFMFDDACVLHTGAENRRHVSSRETAFYYDAEQDTEAAVEVSYGGAVSFTLTDSADRVLGTAQIDGGFNFIEFSAKKGERYYLKAEIDNIGMFDFINVTVNYVKDVKPGVEFSAKSDGSTIYRLVPEKDFLMTLTGDAEHLFCNLFDAEIKFKRLPAYLEAGKTYYLFFYFDGNYTVQENNTEIKVGETVKLEQVGSENVPLVFKPVKDVSVHFFASRDGEPGAATHDEAVSTFISTADDSPITLIDLNRNYDSFRDFQCCFRAEAGKTYVLSPWVYGDPVDCSVTLEECSPYVFENGVLMGDLSGETEVNIPSHYNPPYDPENPGAYLDKDAEGALEVTEIFDTAYSVSDIVSVKLPDTVKKIGEYAFDNCTKLTDVSLSESLETIGDYAFSYSSVKSINIPDSVTEIGDGAFYHCATLEEVKLPSEIEKINGYTFCYCTSLKKIEIPDSVTEIGVGAFKGCKTLDEVKLPSKIEKISGNTFQNCTSLNKIELPETVKEIGYSAFRGCGSLKEVTVPKSVTSIGEDALGYSYEWNDDENARGYKKYDGFTIKGCRGTEAERYANDNGFTFIALDDGEPNPTVYGDANGDGEIDISDVTAIQKYAAAYEKFNAAQLKFADVNKDGAVDINDATAVQKYIAGIIKSFD